ncbi:MAG: hypothetical protein KVP17_003854 [Porospora cf. gigantea B]|uniref:uncharacterized protein n=2 Tax=Porospora cf. gigantea B TaxID=2853592 RepID=UPI003571BD0D|nr:MAG: hypothetical protein KVP17_003854 [Porospora cf. gigantea B]
MSDACRRDTDTSDDIWLCYDSGMSQRPSHDNGVREQRHSFHDFGLVFNTTMTHFATTPFGSLVMTSIKSSEFAEYLHDPQRRASIMNAVMECALHVEHEVADVANNLPHLRQLTQVLPAKCEALTRLLKDGVDPAEPQPRRQSWIDEWSRIQTRGEIFETMQSAKMYADSKNVVDLVALADPNDIVGAYRQLDLSDQDLIELEQGSPEIRDIITKFKNTWFQEAGCEFDLWNPPDWKESIAVADKLRDSRLASFCLGIHGLWRGLGRRLSQDVLDHPLRYTHIPIPHPFVMPGGRFTEIYYWDSYWIIMGLIHSEMYETAKGMIRNFCYMVERLGFIPNGSRSYYVSRSQPPYLTQMLRLIFQATADTSFIKECLPLADAEYQFWMSKRRRCLRLENRVHVVNIFNAENDQPREESFREDRELLSKYNVTGDDAKTLMRNIRAACETGWDFSSRWAGPKMADVAGQGIINVLPYLKTVQVIPVDLNSLMAANERCLRNLHHTCGEEQQAMLYMRAYSRRCQSMDDLMWNERAGCYFDSFVSDNGHITHNKQFFPSNVHPLVSQCFPPGVDRSARNKAMLSYLRVSGVLDYVGGIPTSLNKTQQQWDFGNVWPPLVHNVVVGLAHVEDSDLIKESRLQAEKWIRTCFLLWKETTLVYEKVSTEEVTAGFGGEYEVQTGFGWTNGVILDLLALYPDMLLEPDD